MSELSNFRKNFETALEIGREIDPASWSLNKCSEDLGMSIAYLSRVKTGRPPTEGAAPVTPGIERAERIASYFGFFLREMLLPPVEFRRLAKEKMNRKALT